MMEVILLEKIHNLGKLGDRVRVRPGYGRNYLVPRQKAVPATGDNVAKFEARRAGLEAAQRSALESAMSRAEKLQDLELTIIAKAGNEGRLYGSVGATEICAALAVLGHSIEKKELRLASGALRNIGRHVIELEFHADLNPTITVVIATEDVGR